MNGSEVGTGKHGRCREVAVVGRWPLVEVRLYAQIYFWLQSDSGCTYTNPF